MGLLSVGVEGTRLRVSEGYQSLPRVWASRIRVQGVPNLARHFRYAELIEVEDPSLLRENELLEVLFDLHRPARHHLCSGSRGLRN